MCHRAPPDYSLNTYMGIHLGIEKLEAVILNSKFELIHNAVIRYDVDLPEYKTQKGVNPGVDLDQFEVNPVMYIKALHILFNCLVSQGADLYKVAAIAGAAHHHGAIYWSLAGLRALCGLSALTSLHEQLTEKCFTLRSLYWVNDDCIHTQCSAMDKAVGGARKLKKITGSHAFAGLTGPEIRNVHVTYPDEYQRTVRISLISSFLASLLTGTMASIDHSDGSLMNLLDIHEKEWSKVLLEACAPELASRLMPPIATNRLQGRINKYYVTRWKFRSDCMIVAATNSNSSLLAGIKDQENVIILSLSQHDMIILPTMECNTEEEGQTMCHPTIPNAYMSLFRFPNGGLVRERICQEVADGSWTQFDEMLADTPIGNEGNIAIHFDEMELTPKAQGTLRWDSAISELATEALTGRQRFEPRFEARAVIEAQMMHHCGIVVGTGLIIDSNTRIIAIGEHSSNSSILQIVADVFNAPVYRYEMPADPRLMGAAYRARYAFYEYREVNCNCCKCKIRHGSQPQLSYSEFIQNSPDYLKLACEPTPNCDKIYAPLKDRYAQMQRQLAASKPIREARFEDDPNAFRQL